MDEKERKKLDELKLVHKTVKGIMTCDVELPERIKVLYFYGLLIYDEGDKHKMRTFLVATKGLHEHHLLKAMVNHVVEKLETLIRESVK